MKEPGEVVFFVVGREFGESQHHVLDFPGNAIPKPVELAQEVESEVRLVRRLISKDVNQGAVGEAAPRGLLLVLGHSGLPEYEGFRLHLAGSSRNSNSNRALRLRERTNR